MIDFPYPAVLYKGKNKVLAEGWEMLERWS